MPDVPHDEIILTPRKRGIFGALLTRTLPAYSGRHSVGVCDIEIPIEPETYGTFVHQALPDAPAGITIDTIMFSLFYPSEIDKTCSRVVWFPRLRQTIDGFLKMASRSPNFLYRMILYPIAAAAVFGMTFPALGNAPLKSPDADEDEAKSQWPLVIFSHGVGCSRLMYSGIAGELASHGYIVAAVEHRDGTGPSSTITTADGATRDFDFLNWHDLRWPDHPVQPVDDTTLRHDQLKVRLAEFDHVIRIITDLAATGRWNVPTSLKLPDLDWTQWTCIDAERPIMCGHSLGGTAALLAADEKDIRFDFKSVVVFDPAVQRIQPWSGSIACPVLAINSEEFFADPDFERTRTLLKTAASSTIFTIAGATHPSFSDVFLILPSFINKLTGLLVPAEDVLDLTISGVLNFLAGWGEAVKRRARVFDESRDSGGLGRSGSGVGIGLGSGGDGVNGRVEGGNGRESERGEGGILGPPGTLNWHV